MPSITAVLHKEYPGTTPSGGAGIMMRHLLVNLVSKGWDVQVLLRGHGTPSVHDGVHVDYYDWDPQLFAKTKDTDLLITHLGGTPFARRAGLRHDKRVVQLIHNTSEYSVGFLGSGCDLAVYNSQWVADYHHDRRKSRLVRYWQGDGRSSVNPRSLTEWPSIVVRPPAFSDRLISTRPVTGYVTLVNLVPNKGPDIFYALAEQNPELEFLGVQGGYEQNLQVLKSLPNVTIWDHQADMSSVYRRTSVILMPSKYESYGLVAVEALSQGIPVIATDTLGLRECLGDGFVVPERTVTAFQARLETVLENYDFEVRMAQRRYTELVALTNPDLSLFETTLKGMV